MERIGAARADCCSALSEVRGGSREVALTAGGGELLERFHLELQRRLDERLGAWPPARRREVIELGTEAASDLAGEVAYRET